LQPYITRVVRFSAKWSERNSLLCKIAVMSMAACVISVMCWRVRHQERHRKLALCPKTRRRSAAFDCLRSPRRRNPNDPNECCLHAMCCAISTSIARHYYSTYAVHCVLENVCHYYVLNNFCMQHYFKSWCKWLLFPPSLLSTLAALLCEVIVRLFTTVNSYCLSSECFTELFTK